MKINYILLPSFFAITFSLGNLLGTMITSQKSVVEHCGNKIEVAVNFQTHRLAEGDAEYTLTCNDESVSGKVLVIHKYVKAQDKVIRSVDFEINGRI